MGRHNHENSVAIPGYGRPVVLSGDDTFTSGPLTGVFPAGAVPAQSQLYSYIAPSTKKLLADKGDLWAFVSDTPGVKSYYDVTPGSGKAVTGHFIKVPKDIATGRNPDGSELKAADKGYPPPPADGSWQTDLRSATPIGIDGPQWVLEYWSDINNVFKFVRVEDIAYDKRRGKGNVVYIADSGRGRRADQSQDTPNFKSTNGRIWKMVLDPDDPTKVKSLTVFVEGDDNPVQTAREIHQPDNLETTRRGLLVTEDPGSSQQFPVRLHGSERDHGEAVVRTHLRPGRRRGGGKGGPVRRRGPNGRGRANTRKPGRLGVVGHRRCLQSLRPRRVPDRRPGSHSLDREGTR